MPGAGDSILGKIGCKNHKKSQKIWRGGRCIPHNNKPEKPSMVMAPMCIGAYPGQVSWSKSDHWSRGTNRAVAADWIFAKNTTNSNGVGQNFTQQLTRRGDHTVPSVVILAPSVPSFGIKKWLQKPLHPRVLGVGRSEKTIDNQPYLKMQKITQLS